MRSNKPIIILVLVICVVLGLSVLQLVNGKSSADNSCLTQVIGVVRHTVSISGGKASSTQLKANQCDLLTIVNKDDISRRIVFGANTQRVTYDGVSEMNLTKDQSFTVTLNRTGEYYFYDSNHSDVRGYFTVTQRSE